MGPIYDKYGHEAWIVDQDARERIWIAQETSELARMRAGIREQIAMYLRRVGTLHQLRDARAARQLELDYSRDLEAAE